MTCVLLTHLSLVALVPRLSTAGAYVKSMAQYQEMYDRSLNDSDAFWREQARELDWFAPFTSVQHGTFKEGDVAWFLNGKLNVAYNCVDRHVAAGRGDKVAILFEGDDPSDVRQLTYRQLQVDVSKCANVLRRLGVRKGMAVCIYMPMVPAAAVAMLACARIGAPHSGRLLVGWLLLLALSLLSARFASWSLTRGPNPSVRRLFSLPLLSSPLQSCSPASAPTPCAIASSTVTATS